MDLTGLQLRFVTRSPPATDPGERKRYQFHTPPNPPAEPRPPSCCWRNYIAVVTLHEDRRVTLDEYHYRGLAPVPVGEELVGDFWLCFCAWFGSPFVHVPACDGRVVVDTDEWYVADGLTVEEA